MLGLLVFSITGWNWLTGSVLFCFLIAAGCWIWRIIIRRRKKKEEAITEFELSPLNVVRVAFLYQSYLYLSPRPDSQLDEEGRIDLPCETVILPEESVEDALKRLLGYYFKDKPLTAEVRFTVKHHHCSEEEERNTYLFMVDVNKEAQLPPCPGGKLWTLRQLEKELGKGYLSSYFEEEYPHLEMMVEMWSTYR